MKKLVGVGFGGGSGWMSTKNFFLGGGQGGGAGSGGLGADVGRFGGGGGGDVNEELKFL